MLPRRREILLDFFIVLVYAALLIRPYFNAKYTDKWSSIEGAYVADARFLVDHWPHPQWQPLWYAGTRFDYSFPPALRYGTAAISKFLGFLPVQAYHIYVAALYAIGIAAVYLLVRVGSGLRGAAYLAAVATSLMSPIFLFMPRFRSDAWKLEPQRLGVLEKYGEGPHMCALALIPIALAFAWLAFEKPRRWSTGLAALFSAGVAMNNLYGAAALAVFYVILVWSFWITRQEKWIVWPAAAIPGLTYVLIACWFVPSYIKVTAENMKYVSEHGTTWSIWLALVFAVAFASATDRFYKFEKQYTWSIFVVGCVVFFSLNALGNYYYGFRIAGDPIRLLPELDMIYILAIVLLLRWMWNRPSKTLRVAAAILVVAAFITTKGYIRYAWHMFPVWPDYQSLVEYQVPDWIWRNMPEARTYPTGQVLPWFDVWHDLPQLRGGSEQGLLNGFVESAHWETNLGANAEPTVLWMKCLATDLIYVSDQESEVQRPQKLREMLKVVFDDQHGNRLYRVPRRYPARVRLVETAKLNAAKPPRSNDDVDYLRAYADVVENGPDSPATLTRIGPDEMRVHARVAPGQSIVVQESYDPAWRAWSNGQRLTVRKDAIGFMAIDTPPGEIDMALQFRTPLENQFGFVISGFALLGVAGLIYTGLREERRA
jgi:hypothetical protein